jgi:hypothetical protein
MQIRLAQGKSSFIVPKLLKDPATTSLEYQYVYALTAGALGMAALVSLFL